MSASGTPARILAEAQAVLVYSTDRPVAGSFFRRGTYATSVFAALIPCHIRSLQPRPQLPVQWRDAALLGLGLLFLEPDRIGVPVDLRQTSPTRGEIPQVCGVSFGTAPVSAAPGVTTTSQTVTVQVTATLSFALASSTAPAGTQDRLQLNLSVPAPGPRRFDGEPDFR